jgi:alpha-L-fucosidase
MDNTMKHFSLNRAAFHKGIPAMKATLLYLLAGWLAAGTFSTFGADVATSQEPAQPNLKYGLFVHWGLVTFTGDPYRGGGTKDIGQVPTTRFAPSGFQPQQWAQVAKRAGMDFAMLNAKFEDGFAFWPSKQSDYTVANTPLKADVVGEFIAACKAEGILPGIFYSLIDAHNEGTFREKGPVGPPFFDLIKKQLIELHTRYPDIRIQAIDIATKLSKTQFDDLCATVKRLNPQCIILGDQKAPWGQNFGYDTVIKSWFWRSDAAFTPTSQLLSKYSKAMAKGWPFLLSVGPDQAGRVPDDQVRVLMELKELIAANRTPTALDTPAATKTSPAERLKQVKDLYGKGLISKEDYDKKVKEIIDSL